MILNKNLFKKFPIRVIILKQFGNTMKPIFEKGRYDSDRIKTDFGFIQNNYLLLKKEDRKIPAPDNKYYQDWGKERGIILYQYDRHTFYPVSFNGDKVFLNVERPKMKDGKEVLGKDHKPVMETIQKPIFNSTITLLKGVPHDLPSMVSNQNYDKEHWLSDQIEVSERMNRSKDTWSKFGNVITMAVICFMMIIGFYVGVSELTKQMDVVKTGNVEIAEHLKGISDNNRIAMQVLASALEELSGEKINYLDPNSLVPPPS